MENANLPRFSVSDFLAIVNQTLEVSFGFVEIEGEISSFKVNHQKYVFFDLKDDDGSVGCFMTVWQLRTPLEDGMKVLVRATPKVTAWGKFSLTVQAVRPIGEGSLKQASELVRQKLEKEGLFAESRKRALPELPAHIGVVSSIEAAGYQDFVKILGERWGGLQVDVAHVPVQGEAAPEAIVRAIEHFNSCEDIPEVIVIVRGGGSVDDLAAFSDERVVRAIATSRVVTLVGVGHEVDETLSDLVADVRASTPTHAAQILVPDRTDVKRSLDLKLNNALSNLSRRKQSLISDTDNLVRTALRVISQTNDNLQRRHHSLQSIIHQLNPRTVLARGYALVTDARNEILTDEVAVGEMIKIETNDLNIKAEVKNVQAKSS